MKKHQNEGGENLKYQENSTISKEEKIIHIKTSENKISELSEEEQEELREEARERYNRLLGCGG